MYGLQNDLKDISVGSYLEECFFEKEQGASSPKTAKIPVEKVRRGFL